MELNLSTQAVSINEIIYDQTAEQPLECDVLLPDYCPDIQKILRCEVIPSLQSAVVNGDKLSIDGAAVTHLYYLDEQGCIRHAEYKIPYTKAIELRSSPLNPSASVTQNVDYFNCRAVSPRRLDMRGAVSINAKVSGQTEEQVVCSADGAGMQLRKEPAENIRILPQAIRQMSVREEVELGYGKPSVGAVIRYSATASVTDYKVITGKLVTKGELTVKIIYQCEEDAKKLEVMEYELPVSQIIDLDGVDEDCTCSVWYDICGIDVSPKNNADGECRSFSVEMSANACATAQRREEIEAACDCYSTMYECKPAPKQVPMLRLLDNVEENYMYKEMLDLPEGVRSIIDLWCVAGPATVKMEKDCAAVSGKLNICMFAYGDDDMIAYYDQPREYNYQVPIRGEYEAIQFNPIIQADTAAFSMSGREQLEVRCNLHIRGSMYSQSRKKLLVGVSVDETKKKTRKENVLYLYYAAEREPIWEIAKRYNTSVEAIQAGNLLEGSILEEKTMLLIPMK